MSYWLPDKRLISPELGYPGRKPVGPVQIDWEHPLAKGLGFFTLLTDSGDGVHNLAGASGVYTDAVRNLSGGGYSRVATGHGKAIDVAQNTQSRLYCYPDTGLSGDAATYMGGFIYDTGTQDHTLIHIGSQVGALNKPIIWADTFSSSLRPSINAANSVVGTTGSIPVNEFVIWGASFTTDEATNAKLWVKGVLDGSGDCGRCDAIVDSTLWLNEFTGNRETDGKVLFLARWDRELSPAEHKAFNANPYQMLIPA